MLHILSCNYKKTSKESVISASAYKETKTSVIVWLVRSCTSVSFD